MSACLRRSLDTVFAFLVFTLLGFCPASATPLTVTCTDPAKLTAVQALVPELVAWISAHSDYDPEVTPPPDIAFCETGDTVPYEGEWIIADEDLRGAYDLKAQRIWLTLPWTEQDPRGVSTLLHEIVHHLQFAQKVWPCQEAAEWEAYQLQDLWLKEKGVESGFDLPQIRLWSRCSTTVHP